MLSLLQIATNTEKKIQNLKKKKKSSVNCLELCKFPGASGADETGGVERP